MINPLLDSDPWRTIVLVGRRNPGLAEVVGAGSPRDWDIRKGYGLSGAFVVYTGDNLAKFTVRIRLFEDAHFDEWDSWAQLLAKPPRGVRPKALDIYHPALEDLQIRSVVVEDRSQLAPEDETGMWVSEIKFIQFRAPIPMLGKPEGSTAALKDPTAEDKFDKSILYLKEQFQKPTDDLGTVFSRALGGE
ncbi:hypothetical protein [Sorangium sp. So ce362]|uniref:hypothetical protein n=1 Tax=Sorangium sp. So ce362 TaxID=3133303 RepID=UPI003F60D6D0